MVLSPGYYYFTTGIYSPGRSSPFDERANAVCLEVIDAGSLLSNYGIKAHAATMIQLPWETSPPG
jgi:hypothetical protein